MKNILVLAGLFLFVFLLTSCSNEKNTEGNSNIDTAFLADSNFVCQNIKSTDDIKFTGKKNKSKGNDIDDNLYTDSTYKKKFVELTPDQKVKLIGPFVSKELGVNAKYARNLMQAYFISKQDKTGDLQPIILYIVGDDYSSITMIILNKQNKPISGINIKGGKNSGPDEIGNSLIKYEFKSFSFLNGRNITTVRVNHTECTNDSLHKPTIVDSTVFISHINQSGHFKTKKLISKQYSIPYRDHNK